MVADAQTSSPFPPAEVIAGRPTFSRWRRLRSPDVQGEEESGVGSSHAEVMSAEASDSALRSFVAGLDLERSKTVYISTPITTGLAFYQTLAALAGSGKPTLAMLDQAREVAIRENRTGAIEVWQRAKSAHIGHNYVIPSFFDAEGWSQRRYIDFWVDFIIQRVGTLVLAPGWQYSSGSSREFYEAIAADVAVLTSEFEPLSAAQGVELLRVSVAGVAELGVDPISLRETLQRLEAFSRRSEA